MTEEKYQKAFVEGLDIDANSDIQNLKFNDIEEWDSIGHMSLMSALEETFDISLETDDIVDFSSYEKGKEILKKYNVNLN
ncbi:MAG: acyl carrier protein [Rickettsiales bacterium]|nr:acyl carrier protein [Rickettsiales bacterium]|tara:strand:+ start:185 stop:424 length:240 start_codon:yes stop_codon:yes gene_type:complete